MENFYFFSNGEYNDQGDALEIIGIRGKRIVELATLNIPTSPGFILPNAVVRDLPRETEKTWPILEDPFRRMGQAFGKNFDDSKNPLLVKVLESPMLNIVNTQSIHNVGLCDTTVEGFASFVGEAFAYHEYNYLLRHIIKLELEISSNTQKARIDKLKAFQKALDGAKTKAATVAAIAKFRGAFPEAVYASAYKQLMYVINLFQTVIETNPTSEDSALLIQTMVYGNFNDKSCSGDFFTHDIITGENVLMGDFFTQAFDASSKGGKPIGKINSDILRHLVQIGKQLETKFKEIRRVRFTVENGELWIIDQQPAVNKSTQAEIKSLLDFLSEEIVDEQYVIKAIKPGRLSEILHPTLDPRSVAKFPKVSGGIAGSVGAAIGRVFFSTAELLKAYRIAMQKGEAADFILAMPATFAEDVKAIEVAQGVLASEGGYASHAPVVARSLGKVALIYPGIEFKKDTMTIGGKTIKEGDYITLNVPYYEDPAIYGGRGTLMKPTPENSGLLELLELIQKHIGDFDVHANADQPKDATLAKLFKAQGIGLCRTEHMFFNEERILKFRSMIIADSVEERQKILDDLKKDQVKDFYEMLKIMDSLPVTIRLLDAPLHEFLPHTKDGYTEFTAYMQKKKKGITAAQIQERCGLLAEVNPMLGHRGVRVAISYPEIYNMQIRAIFEAAYRLKKEGIEVHPEIMIPVVMTATEVKIIRNGKKIEGKSLMGLRDIEESVRREFGFDDPIDYRVGSMIELPAAALNAGEIAQYAEFFSFGTNDLTQTTSGLSRDDFNNFFSDYNEFDLLPQNPFKVLGDQVKEMIKIASERGRLVRPDISLGLCGEHGAEPENIPFARAARLNYVSCSPYGIPIAKLAIAQLNLEKEQS
ncbi:MAG: pyruvate, phosphate dikinase [Spirochaetales bacterium]|jgi:pyruvate,orthophosphate dikinase|nr:pyruvate, phosphate dikinase [Spirochaetales bacterium]